VFSSRVLTLKDRPDEWNAVARSLNVDADDLLLIRQVHGAKVAFASPERARPWQRPDADVIVTDDPTAAVAVRVADCVPVLLADDSGRGVAAIHAGWRGTVQRAVIAGVQALQRYGIRPERLVAAVGPSIGPCCYEVGENTFQTFREAGHHETFLARWFEKRDNGRFHLDLWRATRDQLEGAGVLPANVHEAGLCTCTHPQTFHSYRVDGDQAGRLVGAIKLRRPA
jgi:purine-nucleoside/S-methyl-5'-thioadenosine phosphorylase / adenosine deaminase